MPPSRVSPGPSVAEPQEVLFNSDFDRSSSDDDPSTHGDHSLSQNIRVVHSVMSFASVFLTSTPRSDIYGRTAAESSDADASALEENEDTAAEDPDPNPDVRNQLRELLVRDDIWRSGRFRRYLWRSVMSFASIFLTSTPRSDINGRAAAESPDADANAPEENENTAAEDPDPNPDIRTELRELLVRDDIRRNGRFRHHLRRLRNWLCG